MNEKGNSSFQIFFPSLTIRFHTFLFAMIIIVSLSILNQDQIAIAQQQQQQQQHQYDSSSNNLSRMKNTISNTCKLTGPYPA
jgi:K+-sensing histidine kinase KdpD